jgi:hypothetical protein
MTMQLNECCESLKEAMASLKDEVKSLEDHEAACPLGKENEKRKDFRQLVVEPLDVETKAAHDYAKEAHQAAEKMDLKDVHVALDAARAPLAAVQETLTKATTRGAIVDLESLKEKKGDDYKKWLKELDITRVVDGFAEASKAYQNCLICISEILVLCRGDSTAAGPTDQTKAFKKLGNDVSQSGKLIRKGVRKSFDDSTAVLQKSISSVQSELKNVSVSEALASFGGGAGGPAVSSSGAALYDRDLKRHVQAGIQTLLGSSLEPPVDGDDAVLRFSQQASRLLNRALVPVEKGHKTVIELRTGVFGPEGVASEEEVRGHQASLFVQFDTARKTMATVVNSLVCEAVECDEDGAQFYRDNIVDHLDKLVSEIGRDGGPILGRARWLLNDVRQDSLTLVELLGIEPQHMGAQRDLSAAAREQNASYYKLLLQYIDQLKQALDSDPDETVGIRIARLARVVNAIPESVDQAHAAMDLAGLSAVDRDAYKEVGGVLDWIRDAARDDWRLRLRDRDARFSELRSIANGARRLIDEVQQLRSQHLGKLVSIGKTHIDRALGEVQAELTTVRELAKQVKNVRPQRAAP